MLISKTYTSIIIHHFITVKITFSPYMYYIHIPLDIQVIFIYSDSDIYISDDTIMLSDGSIFVPLYIQ